MYRRIVLAFMLAIFSIYSVPSLGQEGNQSSAKDPEAKSQSPIQMRSDQIVAMLNGALTEPFESVFSAEFLNAVSPSQLKTLSNQFTSQYGMAIAVEKLDPSQSQSELHIRMERAIAKGRIAIDPADENRIIGLRFVSFEPINDSLEKIEADLKALPGSVSALFMPLVAEPIISIAPDQQMAIGSTFKLYVLAALTQEIAQGNRAWDDVVTLDSKSFPSGAMQDWPEGAPVTLHTLASMMISISDNTATDQLIKVLGRARIEKAVKDHFHSQPELNTPFLMTRELFELKGGDPDRLAAYQRATPEGRRQILRSLGNEPVTREDIDAAFAQGPVAVDVEWLASAGDLAILVSAFADQQASQILSINENITETARKNWNYVGYKGGSEPGVLNLTWLLTDKAGVFHMLSLSWNNPDAVLDETKLELIAQRILSLPRE